MSPSGSQGTQCVHQDFSSRRRHGYMPAERIHVCILGHTGRILGSYLRDKSRHSNFVAMTQLENRTSQPCLIDLVHKIFGLYNHDLIKNSFPMVVITFTKSFFTFCAPIFIDKHHRVRAQRSRWE
jgi:hypothetical protein